MDSTGVLKSDLVGRRDDLLGMTHVWGTFISMGGPKAQMKLGGLGGKPLPRIYKFRYNASRTSQGSPARLELTCLLRSIIQEPQRG